MNYSFEGHVIDLDDAGNETLVEKEDKTEPTGDEAEDHPHSDPAQDDAANPDKRQ